MEDLDIEDAGTPPPVTIVTGAAHGIGLATARRLAARGDTVVAVDVDEAALRSAPLPDDAVRVVHDIADDPTDLVTQIEARHGTPTVLVNNAARTARASFLEAPLDEVRRSFDVNLLGTWAITQAVARRMVAAGSGGAVVFILSLHSRRVRMSPDYSASKAALLMLVRELADELGPHGIRVNAVSPGAVDTWSDRIDRAEVLVERSRALVPLGRLGEPDDVAKVVEFLTDPDASGYVTGADVKVDGGLDQCNWVHHLHGSAAAERAARAERAATAPDPEEAPGIRG